MGIGIAGKAGNCLPIAGNCVVQFTLAEKGIATALGAGPIRSGVDRRCRCRPRINSSCADLPEPVQHSDLSRREVQVWRWAASMLTRNSFHLHLESPQQTKHAEILQSEH